MTGKWYNSLRVQIALLLTLALLPIGAVAIYQTNRVEAESVRNAELALLALTGRAAKEEELILESTFGVARFFGSIAEDYMDDPDLCTTVLSRFLDRNPTYSFIGVLPLSGQMTCSSSGRHFDFSSYPGFADDMAAQQRTVAVNLNAPLSGQSVFVVSEPFSRDGEYAGLISISIPHNNLANGRDDLSELGLVDLITFSAAGDILTTRNDLDIAVTELPQGRTLQALKHAPRSAFQGVNMSGNRRVYTVVPIEGSPVSVLAVWDVNNDLGHRIGELMTPAVFPALMWIASMAVAMLSVHTLVLRHVKTLREKMNKFARDRTLVQEDGLVMPTEVQELASNFDQMAEDILHEEAKQENTLREKNVLIKEVHHRVKNNLQLISSIMNMQIRTAEHEETKSVLARLQDRVLSLATIHRDLYQSENGGLVNAGALVEEIIAKAVEASSDADQSVKHTTDFDRVWLYPDQAVPLSLLMAESAGNATKYIDVVDGNEAWISASLKQMGRDCVVTLSNSVGSKSPPEGAGLGAQLITAFAIQLGGKIEIERSDGSYTMFLRFEIEEFAHEARDF